MIKINDLITFKHLQLVCFLLDDHYFKNYYKMIAIDLGKQQALYADLKTVQQINFNSNDDRGEDAAMFFIIEKESSKRNQIRFFKWNHKSIVNLFCFNIMLIKNNKITQCNTLKKELLNSQLNKLELGIKNGTRVS